MNLNLYRKQYVVVPVQRPTFVFTCKGKFLRVDNYVYKLPKAGSVAQETWLVSDNGLCFMYDGREMQIFTAPVTPHRPGLLQEDCDGSVSYSTEVF